MAKLPLPDYLEDKIFEIQFDDDGSLSKVISYFPLSASEKEKIVSVVNNSSFDGFSSIFTDTISQDEWNRTKDQIKKKFNDELFDID